MFDFLETFCFDSTTSDCNESSILLTSLKFYISGWVLLYYRGWKLCNTHLKEGQIIEFYYSYKLWIFFTYLKFVTWKKYPWFFDHCLYENCLNY